jgi:prophage DNA circulation protein
MIYTHAAAGIAGAVLAGVLAWNVQAWRYDAQLSKIHAQHASESAKAEAATRAQEASFSQQLQDAQNAATKRETKLRADADTARRTADGLRGTLYEFRASLPNASTSALIARADTAAELLGTCVGEYRAVAEAADRHAGDALMLQEAWPK